MQRNMPDLFLSAASGSHRRTRHVDPRLQNLWRCGGEIPPSTRSRSGRVRCIRDNPRSCRWRRPS